MTGDPPSRQSQSECGRREQAQPEGQRRETPAAHDERYGPVAVARLRKDDGRALLLYTRAEPAPE